MEIVSSDAGNTLDPMLEQDNYDCTEIGPTDHPDFMFKDPYDIKDEQPSRSHFKPVELYDDDTLLSMCRSLDDDQKIVLEIGVNYAKKISVYSFLIWNLSLSYTTNFAALLKSLK